MILPTSTNGHSAEIKTNVGTMNKWRNKYTYFIFLMEHTVADTRLVTMHFWETCRPEPDFNDSYQYARNVTFVKLSFSE